MMLIRLAWKNIWRNKLRSLVVLGAFAVGIAAGLFATAFMAGMVKQRVEAITGLEVSHLQIHRVGYRDTQDLKLVIPKADSLIRNIAARPEVAGVSGRLIFEGMMTTADRAAGARIIAVNPEAEKQVSTLPQMISRGAYFTERSSKTLLMSERLAEKMKLDLAKPVIISIEDVRGGIIRDTFSIGGLFRTDNAGFDESTVFIRYDEACALSGTAQGDVHEIAVLMKEVTQIDEMLEHLKRDLPDQEVLTWLQLSPEAASLVSVMNEYMEVFMIIILLALCFGVINTMLMAVLERTREIGMLMAVGMSKKRVFGLIIWETIFLSMSGGLIGLIAGGSVIGYTGIHGIDLSFWAEAFSGLGYPSLIYPSLDLNTLISTAMLLFFTGLFSALYPAYRALRQDPAQAIRTD